MALKFIVIPISDPDIVRSYRGEIGKGLPIGSLTSQHFANDYLGVFDRYVKDTLRVKGYVRYMDDMILWSAHREDLVSQCQRCREFLRSELGLEFNAAQIKQSSDGFEFLGCRVYRSHLELNRRSKRRLRKRLLLFHRAEQLGIISQHETQKRFVSLLAFASAAGVRSWRFRRDVVERWAVDDP
jgi:hypothetical protein